MPFPESQCPVTPAQDMDLMSHRPMPTVYSISISNKRDQFQVEEEARQQFVQIVELMEGLHGTSPSPGLILTMVLSLSLSLSFFLPLFH